MIVADVNTLAYFWINGELTADAQRVFELDPEWCAPLLWRSEFRNLLLGYVRKNLFSMEQALLAIHHAEKQMHAREIPVTSRQVVQCANESTCSGYDCEYVALAKALRVKLVTSDKKILREFPHTAISMKDFITKPFS